MQTHKRKTIQRLLQYSAGTLGVLCAHDAAGQMVYTDLDPDIVLDYGFDPYLLDIDNNGTDDFELQWFSSFTVWTEPWGSVYTSWYQGIEITPLGDAEIEVTPAGKALVLDAGNWVDGDGTFSPDAARAVFIDPGASQFLGLRFTIDGNTNYGWMRLKIWGDPFTLLDYAYEATPETPIYTEAPGTPSAVLNITMEDISDTHTVADLQVSFDAPADESNIAVYRIFVGPAAFTPYYASIATSEKYTEVVPTGTSQTVTINASQLDNLGQPIAEFEALRVSVYSVGFTEPFDNILVNAPYDIVLGHAVQPPINVEVNIEPANAWDPSEGILPTFSAPADLHGIINFFSYVVPADMLASLDTTSLCGNSNHFILNNYMVPGGSFYALEDYDINVTEVDITGAAISLGQSYAVCVLSHTLVADYSGCSWEQITCSDVFVTVEETVNTQNIIPDPLQVFIAADGIHVHANTEQGELFLYDISGRLISRMSLQQKMSMLPLPESSGWYVIAMRSLGGVESVPLLYLR